MWDTVNDYDSVRGSVLMGRCSPTWTPARKPFTGAICSGLEDNRDDVFVLPDADSTTHNVTCLSVDPSPLSTMAPRKPLKGTELYVPFTGDPVPLTDDPFLDFEDKDSKRKSSRFSKFLLRPLSNYASSLRSSASRPPSFAAFTHRSSSRPPSSANEAPVTTMTTTVGSRPVSSYALAPPSPGFVPRTSSPLARAHRISEEGSDEDLSSEEVVKSPPPSRSKERKRSLRP